MVKVCLIGSHGGHLYQLLKLINPLTLAGHSIFIITYRESKYLSINTKRYVIKNIGYNPLYMIMGFLNIAFIIKKEKPNILISTGSEIAIPSFLLGKVYGLYTIFIESYSRVVSPSWTGRIVYLFSDFFFVQSPDLLKSYGPKARYSGELL